MIAPDNLDDFINLLNADPRLSANAKGISNKINSWLVNIETQSDPLPRPSATKEQAFVAKAREQLTPAEVQLVRGETTTEGREDKLAELLRAKLNAATGDAKSEALAVIMELRQLREQYERLGGTMGDPNFGQANGVYTTQTKERWVILKNGGADVTPAYVASIIFND